MSQAVAGIEEQRTAERFVIKPAIEATFFSTALSICDLSERGAQAEHASPLKVGTTARLFMAVPGLSSPLDLQTVVTWSRLSQKADSTGKLLYRTGLRFEEDFEVARGAVERLILGQRARADEGSLLRKKSVLEERERIRSIRPTMKPIVMRRPEVDYDQVLLIQHAHDQLRTHPEEASKWYNRAKFSLSEGDFVQLQYRDDVLATWEYLGRTIDVATIAKVFEKK